VHALRVGESTLAPADALLLGSKPGLHAQELCLAADQLGFTCSEPRLELGDAPFALLGGPPTVRGCSVFDLRQLTLALVERAGSSLQCVLTLVESVGACFQSALAFVDRAGQCLQRVLALVRASLALVLRRQRGLRLLLEAPGLRCNPLALRGEPVLGRLE
jgi:hypothetical protein